MTAEPFPKFKYHPDPIRSGSIVESDRECAACGQQRGWIYTGAVYAQADLDDMLCPWCIADGLAHARFDAEFVDPQAVGGYGKWDPVPAPVIEEISFRTPSFSGWQQEHWFTHCNDATAFIGPMGMEELRTVDSTAYEAIANETRLSGEELTQYMNSLHRDNGPTAYLFRCCHCGIWGGYSDIY